LAAILKAEKTWKLVIESAILVTSKVIQYQTRTQSLLYFFNDERNGAWEGNDRKAFWEDWRKSDD
jgi:thymidylate synthase